MRRVSLVARTTLRTCRAHYPGGSKRVHVSIASPSHTAFPFLWEGRHPHCPFRGLLRLHSRYGPYACSTAQGGLCHGASTGPVTQPRRPSATSAIDNSLGGTLLHKCFAPSRRTRESGHRRCASFAQVRLGRQRRSSSESGHSSNSPAKIRIDFRVSRRAPERIRCALSRGLQSFDPRPHARV